MAYYRRFPKGQQLDPTPAEIAERCKEIQRTWSVYEERYRRRWSFRMYELSEVCAIRGRNVRDKY